MTEQAKNKLLDLAAEGENMYKQGILDGITLIRNMLNEEPAENTVWTPELIKETCDAFIEKYTAGNGEGIPDIPNLVDEVPEEYKNAGIDNDIYGDLLSILSEATEDSTPEVVNIEDINGMIIDGGDATPMDGIKVFPDVDVVEEDINPIPNAVDDCMDRTTLPYTKLDEGITKVLTENTDKSMEEIEIIGEYANDNVPIQMDITDVMKNAIIQTESGEEIPLADCLTVETEPEE